MNKQQILIISSGLIILLGLYFFAPTVNPLKGKITPSTSGHSGDFSIDSFRNMVVGQLTSDRKLYLDSLEKTGETSDGHRVLHLLSTFWKDSVNIMPLHYFYESKLAELDNTEKSLTFAAHSILGYLPYEGEHDVQHWLAGRGKELFDKALVINPDNDSSIVGLGGCIMYGAPAEEGGNAMEGILKVREVAEKDSNNLFAQYMLGVGGIISKQYDKAALRFEKVIKGQPDNMEAMFKLAESYEMAGDKEKAATCYEKISNKVSNPELKMELNRRIATLKGG